MVGALLVSDGRILLGFRASNRRSYPDCWDVIGGHVEAGETGRAALIREIGEEIGVSGDGATYFTTLNFDDAVRGPSRLDIFLVRRWTGVLAAKGHEHSEIKWFTPAQAALTNLASAEYVPLFRRLQV